MLSNYDTLSAPCKDAMNSLYNLRDDYVAEESAAHGVSPWVLFPLAGLLALFIVLGLKKCMNASMHR
jgi:hypothetical protein